MYWDLEGLDFRLWIFEFGLNILGGLRFRIAGLRFLGSGLRLQLKFRTGCCRGIFAQGLLPPLAPKLKSRPSQSFTCATSFILCTLTPNKPEWELMRSSKGPQHIPSWCTEKLNPDSKEARSGWPAMARSRPVRLVVGNDYHSPLRDVHNLRLNPLEGL